MTPSTLHYHSSFLRFVFLILFLMLTFSFTVSSDASEEANALFKWKTSLHHYHLNSSILPSWTLQPVNATPTTSMCSWSGIHCSQARRVIAIYLTNMSLKEFAGIYGYAAPELAYTMKVTEKCNVYSFGVLALEVINGKHPGDFLSSISSSSPNTNISLDQVLDPRLPYPSFDVRSKLTSIMNIAFLCVDKNPNSRPIMSTVSQLLCM
ncbi:putative Receptor protein kinase [Melia azedarach]|uniref:Receptor protein kinase n=1 Tax=Melia azedarach TaxID=155640 RepID=A0ACC1YK90_MELAZ|nr:putative Receptor protein kinase [Melia azedarach]